MLFDMNYMLQQIDHLPEIDSLPQNCNIILFQLSFSCKSSADSDVKRLNLATFCVRNCLKIPLWIDYGFKVQGER